MSFQPIPARIRFARGLFVVAFSLAAAACGGGSQDASAALNDASPEAPPAATRAHKAAALVSVVVEGCVLDRHHVPTTGTPVRVLATDGRLLANTRSDGQGRFTLRLPAHSEVLLQVDRPQGESLPMRVDAQPSTWATCLLDEQA